MGTNQKKSIENLIKGIRRKTRWLFSPEQKILMVMETPRGIVPSERYKGLSYKLSTAQAALYFIPIFNIT